MAQEQPPGRWPIAAFVAWTAVTATILMLVLAKLWTDDLSECGPGRMALHWASFMSATFLFHAALAMGAVAVFAVLVRRKRLLVSALAVMPAALATETWPMITRRGAPDLVERAEGTESTALRVMSINLMYGRMDVEKLVAQVERVGPDVVMFQEWTPSAAAALRPRLQAQFPHRVEAPRDDAFGQAVYSRRAFSAPPREYPPVGSVGVPQISVVVEHGSRPLGLANIHILPPVRLGVFAELRRMAAGLREWMGMEGAPDVLAGDFNAVNGSAVMRAISGGGLRDAFDEGGTGLRGTTWPRSGRLRHLPGVRIDHVMINPRLACRRAWVEEDFGSDHRAVVADLEWKN